MTTQKMTTMKTTKHVAKMVTETEEVDDGELKRVSLTVEMLQWLRS